MNQDPNKVRRARLSARAWAEVANGFVEEISLKTMGVLFAGLIVALVVTNGTCTLFRRQYENSHPVQVQPYWQGQQQVSGSYAYPGQIPMTPGGGLGWQQQQNLVAWEQNQSQIGMGQPEGGGAGYGYEGSPKKLAWYGRSPIKDMGRERGRSRSPEKKMARM